MNSSAACPMAGGESRLALRGEDLAAELRTNAYQGVDVPSRIFRGSPIGYLTMPAFFTARAAVSTSSQVAGGVVTPAFFSIVMSTSVPRKSEEYGTPIWWPPCTKVARADRVLQLRLREVALERREPAGCAELRDPGPVHLDDVGRRLAARLGGDDLVVDRSHASVCMSTLMPVFVRELLQDGLLERSPGRHHHVMVVPAYFLSSEPGLYPLEGVADPPPPPVEQALNGAPPRSRRRAQDAATWFVNPSSDSASSPSTSPPGAATWGGRVVSDATEAPRASMKCAVWMRGAR